MTAMSAMTTTLLVDLNMADGVHLDVFLEPETYVEGSPATPPLPGEFVMVVAEGGVSCMALVESVDGLDAVLKLDLSTWYEAPKATYTNPFETVNRYTKPLHGPSQTEPAPTSR